MKRTAFRRAGLAFVIGLVLGAVVSEGTFALVRENERPAQTFRLVVPAGTAELVKLGQQPPSLPAQMSFVVGDQLLVINQDSVSHQLGPIWIPPGSEGRLALDMVGQYADQCSFQTAKILNLDVQEPLTPWTRFEGAVIAGAPMGALFAVYALVAWPEKKKTTGPSQ